MKFPPDLIARVRYALARVGYCFLNGDELHRLLAAAPHRTQTRHDAMQEFAEICRAEVEATEHLSSARFVPLRNGRETSPHRLAIPMEV